MTDIFEAYQGLFLLFSFLSLFFFLGSLLALPWFVGKLPVDYFVNFGKNAKKPVLVRILRNVLGGVVFLAGIIMLFIPGQGLLTMVAGLVIMDFPGKSDLIMRLARLPKVRYGLNWLRDKGGKPPLIFPGTGGK